MWRWAEGQPGGGSRDGEAAAGERQPAARPAGLQTSKQHFILSTLGSQFADSEVVGSVYES